MDKTMSRLLLNRSKVLTGTLFALAFLTIGTLRAAEGDRVEASRIGLGGYCPVCQVHHNKRVAGKPEFTEIKDGFRYRFVSDREQAAFRKDPGHYVDQASKPKAMESPTSQRPKLNSPLTVTGRTRCAGCDFGVGPIQNPEELGLAVNTDDGRVVIVEQAHKLYRDAYEHRYGWISTLTRTSDTVGQLSVTTDIASGFHIYAQSQPRPFLATTIAWATRLRRYRSMPSSPAVPPKRRSCWTGC
jgi:hypothetical protein